MAQSKEVRIMELRGTYKGGGGPDKTILLSAAAHNPNDFYILVVYLRSPNDAQFQIGRLARRLGVRNYVEVADRRTLDFKCLFALHALIKSHRIQIVHVHDTKTTLLGVLLKILNPRISLLHTAHGWLVNTSAESLKQKLHFLLLKFYPFHIAVSRATKQLMVRHGLQPARITVLHNSIDENVWCIKPHQPNIRKELNIPSQSLVIGTVGRLSPEKDLPTFLQVARNVCTYYPDTKFLIVGQGTNGILDRLRAMAEELGLSNAVLFLDHRSDAIPVYRAFDIFLSTSLSEGLPNTVLEAMAMEVPVVATRVGGVPELVRDGTTGLLSHPRDVENLTAHILDLLTHPQKRSLFASRARERISAQFSFRHRLNLIQDYYSRIAGYA
jgi:glycosyltransferase involved in cell wall biosynthesis